MSIRIPGTEPINRLTMRRISTFPSSKCPKAATEVSRKAVKRSVPTTFVVGRNGVTMKESPLFPYVVGLVIDVEFPDPLAPVAPAKLAIPPRI